MHRTEIDTEEYGKVYIHHNGDWSGELIIRYDDKYNDVKGRETLIPADLFFQIGKKVAFEKIRDEIENFLDELEDDKEDYEEYRRKCREGF